MVPLGLDMRSGECYWDGEERIALRYLDLGLRYDQHWRRVLRTVLSGSDFVNFWTHEILRLCAPGHASAYPHEGYKTVLILETPFWVAGAAESMKISIIIIGASNKSGRH